MIALIANHEDAKKLIWQADHVNYQDLRSNEIEIVSSKYIPLQHRYLAVYDIRYLVKLQAGLGIIQTFIVCVILSAGALMFQKITQDLVISPIEHMIERVNHISRDPLQAAHEDEERLLMEEMMEQNIA